jgi:hypothetical protein
VSVFKPCSSRGRLVLKEGEMLRHWLLVATKGVHDADQDERSSVYETRARCFERIMTVHHVVV